MASKENELRVDHIEGDDFIFKKNEVESSWLGRKVQQVVSLVRDNKDKIGIICLVALSILAIIAALVTTTSFIMSKNLPFFANLK